MVRRAVECVLASVALIVLAPLFLLIALAIRLDSRGPVFYSQIRAGRAGRPFRLHKFRSMLTDRPGPPLTRREDDRVTRAGRLLRPCRLDELPQLWNVVRGEMSLVGPRPELPSIVARYRPEDRRVLEVRPGLIGPTQLAWLDEAERCPPDADPLDYYLEHVLPEKLRSDLHYVRTRSLRTDAWCLVRTPFVLGLSAMSSARTRALARRPAGRPRAATEFRAPRTRRPRR
jgi:lipopolysaccharide/colanic/teichoic acid biosynthesis glycosyltransferase